MKLGIAIEETWDFFREIYASLETSYETRLFKRRRLRGGPMHSRINRWLFDADLRSFLAANDVVFFEWASELLVAASHKPKHCGIVTRLHRYELYQWADRVNWDAVDRIILVSKAKQGAFNARFPAQAAKTVVSSPSTSLEKFAFRRNSFGGNIGILCHLTPRKRVYELILAFSEMLAEEPGLRLHIAGGAPASYGDYSEALHYLVRRLKLEDKVAFYGNVAAPWEWYPQIDIFISNSYSEGLQVAPMEAMACGCCTLSHHWEGAEELVPSDHLFLTDREMQRKVLDFCALPEADKLAQAQAMREWACTHFDIRQTIADVRRVIDETYAAQQGDRRG